LRITIYIHHKRGVGGGVYAGVTKVCNSTNYIYIFVSIYTKPMY
jgi:hypothetical protein